jgi:coenzyme F420-0:L-glutamate ligase / coenzyme F420-1:gamma-L-glutamate ligase
MAEAGPALPRRMIRRYTDAPVHDAAVKAMLQAATTAPSPHNRQPWRFAVIRGAARFRLAEAMGTQLRADRLRDGDPGDVIDRDVARSHARITNAPVSILVCMTLAEMDRYPDARRAEAERWMAAQAVACATQNVLIAAAALGLGACWMCAPLFCGPTVRDALGLSDDWEPQSLITIGHPADEGRIRPRKALADVTRYLD